MLSRFIPYGVKLMIRQNQRKLRDKKTGAKKLFATAVDKIEVAHFTPLVTLKQPIYYNPLSANKIENIKIAQQKIENILIHPNQIFSFWELVKKPTKKDGYKSGRNIIGDALQEDIGGGLCQISGIIYHLALIAGVKIIERHNHTIDLYTEENRYTPIGTDATVVYGFKDVRFQNSTDSILSLQFEISDIEFTATLLAEKLVPLYDLRFERTDSTGYREVKTFRSNRNLESTAAYNFAQEEFVNLSRYKL